MKRLCKDPIAALHRSPKGLIYFLKVN